MSETLPLIDRVRVVGPYRLRLWFSDGQMGEWSFDRLATDERPVALPFREPGFFEQVFLDFGALTWPNGYDLSPVALYDDMTAAGALKLESAAA